MADYVDLEALKKTLELTGETYADDDLRLAITTASAAVDDTCGRRFSLDEDDQTRQYVPARANWLEIDDLTALTTVEADLESDGTFGAWATTDYRLEPLNALNDGWPYTVLRLAEYGMVSQLEPTFGIIRITGKFGWPEIPPSVEQATKMLASRFLKRVRDAPLGIAGIGADGIAVRVAQTDPDVATLLRPYTRSTRLA